MAASGNTFAILQGIGYWAPLQGAAIPGPHLAYGDPMPAGWNPIVDTVNGFQATFRNPRAAITSEERGRIGQVPAGDEGTAVALQFRSIGFDLLKLVSALQSRTLAARSEVQTLTVTTGASATGTVTVTLNGTAYNVALTGTAPLTTDAVATQLRAAAYAGWTTGGTGSSVVFTASTTGPRNGTYGFAAGATGVVAAFGANPTKGINTTEVAELDKNVPMGFMLSVEGIATAGSFFANRRYVRYVMYNVENTANAEHILRHSGADAAFAPSVTLEALPVPAYSAAMLAGSGLTAADLDKNRRANIFFIDAPTV